MDKEPPNPLLAKWEKATQSFEKAAHSQSFPVVTTHVASRVIWPEMVKEGWEVQI